MLHTRTDVRWRDLRRAILEVRPAILHFSGHGHAGHLKLTDDVGGVSQLVPLTALRALLGGGLGVRLLVLNGCDTAEHVPMFLDVVDHVIGMRGAISDEGASVFAQGFYSALANGHGIETSFAVGKSDIEARSLDPSDLERPVLRSRLGAPGEIAGGATGRAADPLVAPLRAVRTRRNVYPLLPRALAEQLADAFPLINDVIDVVGRADALIQQAGDDLPEDFRGCRLRVGHVPLQAGAYHAWSSAVRDAAAISPHALMALLLVAREHKEIGAVTQSIELIRSLDPESQG
jgi:hypothetical protein